MLATHVCRDIRCSSVFELPDRSTHGLHSKRLDICGHSDSLLSPDSIGLSPSYCTSTSPDGADCTSVCPSSNAHEPSPNTSNRSTVFSNIESISAVHGSTDNGSSRHVCESPHASGQGSLPGIAASSCVFDEAPTRARSPAVEVVGLQPLKKAPRGNSVKQYHRLDSLQGVVFYQTLEVTDEYGKRHSFDLRDRTQGALVSVSNKILHKFEVTISEHGVNDCNPTNISLIIITKLTVAGLL